MCTFFSNQLLLSVKIPSRETKFVCFNIQEETVCGLMGKDNLIVVEVLPGLKSEVVMEIQRKDV